MTPTPDEGVRLEACPFCGGTKLEPVSDGVTEWMVCRTCGCDGPVARNEATRVALWNQRTPAPLALSRENLETARDFCRRYLLDERYDRSCCMDDQHMADVIALFDALGLDENGALADRGEG